MGCRKEGSTGEIPGGPSTSPWAGGADVWDACGPMQEYGGALRTPAAAMRCLRNCAERPVTKKGNLWLPQGAGLYWGQFGLDIDAQLEAEMKVKTLEEELRYGRMCSIHGSASSGLTHRLGEQVAKFRDLSL